MRWQGRRQSSNVEDRRGSGGFGGGKLLGGGIGTVVIALIVYLLGGNPGELLESQQSSNTYQTESSGVAPQDEDGQFVATVLADTEDVWSKLLAEQNLRYSEPALVLFSGYTTSGCGNASSTTGPFYCPLDEKVYIDLSFYQDLKTRFRAPGDFAMAYVVAHEVGHHIQHLLGTSDKVHELRQRLSEAEGNKLSVMLELQADFYAGVWAHHADKMKSILEEGDIEEALNAANAIGDDRLQRESRGTVVPESFTHGTSKQRMYWFKKGFQTGRMEEGDTFSSGI